MTEIKNHILAQVPHTCLAAMCDKDRCSLEQVPPGLLIDTDCQDLMDVPGLPVSRTMTRCDYLFLSECDHSVGVKVVPIELKPGRHQFMHAVEQLQAGSRLADALLPLALSKTQFIPIVAYRHARRVALIQLQRDPQNTICFRQQKRAIKAVKCGSSLTSALNG